MQTLQETIETIREEDATYQRLTADGGNPLRGRQSPEHLSKLAEAARFLQSARNGYVSKRRFEEAMTTSDFPQLFTDILDRQLLGNWQAQPSSWQNYMRRATVPDFRDVKRFGVDGGTTTLSEVNEKAEYPEDSVSDSVDSYSVRKYGRTFHISWETMVNDDLDALNDFPQRMATAARRSEEKFATELFVDGSGPHASLYTGARNNIIDGNPELSIEGLQDGFEQLSSMTDPDGEPISMEMVELVVPPALEIVAMNILNATELRVNNAGGTSNQLVITQNWMRGRLRLNVNYYIPQVASSNGNTSWFLFASPGTSRPALEMGFLRGHEEPQMFRKAPNSNSIGGGEEMFSFENDSTAFKLRHVFGGTRYDNTGGWRSTVASNGSGS